MQIAVRYLLCLVLLHVGVRAADAQVDQNMANPHSLVTVSRADYTLSGLVTHQAGAAQFKYGIAIFPGAPGILKLREMEGGFNLEQRGNFLVRARRHWLDEETLVVLVDAPSDQWSWFSQRFRETPRYGADVTALLTEVGRRYNVGDWTLVGTSEGSVSATHAARMNPQLARRLILTASLMMAAGHGPGLSNVRWTDVTTETLWVHHEKDPCTYASYREARGAAREGKRPLLTIRGGTEPRGPDCEPYTQHGFVGQEREVILAMKGWIKTGVVPPDF